MPLYQVKRKIVVTEVYEVEASDRKTAEKRVSSGNADVVDSSMTTDKSLDVKTISKRGKK